MFYFVLRCYCSIKVACANFDDSSYNGNVKLKNINARNHEDYSKYITLEILKCSVQIY